MSRFDYHHPFGLVPLYSASRTTPSCVSVIISFEICSDFLLSQLANSTLINGLGRYSGGDTTSPLAVITVESGKRYQFSDLFLKFEAYSHVTLYSRYRFRLISTSCDPSYNFAIDNHTMTIIEADGQNTQPLVVDSLQIYAAQRYSFVVCSCLARQHCGCNTDSELFI